MDKIAEIEHAIAEKDEELDRQELQQQQAANTEFFGTIFPAINPKNLADKIQYLRNYNTRGNIYLESRLHRMIYNLERQQKQAPKQTMQTESTEAKRRQQEEQRQQKFIEAVKTNLGIYQSHQAKVNYLEGVLKDNPGLSDTQHSWLSKSRNPLQGIAN